MLKLGLIDLCVIAIYFALMVFIGLLVSQQNLEHGRRFGTLLMVMFGFGLGTSADTAVGVASRSYKIGMAGNWYQWLHIFQHSFFLAWWEPLSMSGI